MFGTIEVSIFYGMHYVYRFKSKQPASLYILMLGTLVHDTMEEKKICTRTHKTYKAQPTKILLKTNKTNCMNNNNKRKKKSNNLKQQKHIFSSQLSPAYVLQYHVNAAKSFMLVSAIFFFFFTAAKPSLPWEDNH